MGYRSIASAFVASIIVLASVDIVRSQRSDVSCSMDRMEENARSVIEPCTQLLQSAISDRERGLALFVRGRGYHRSGQIPLAAADYDAALDLISDNEELWLSRSNAASRLGDAEAGSRYMPTHSSSILTMPTCCFSWGCVRT